MRQSGTRSALPRKAALDRSNDTAICRQKIQNGRERRFASGDLLFEESCDLISKFAADKGTVSLMVDGIDECNENAGHLLIQGFNEIMQNSSTAAVKVLISSRDSPYLTAYFEEHQTYEVSVKSNRNQQDIGLYVEKQLSLLIDQKKLRLDERQPPSAKLQRLIITRLCDGAQGM